MSKGIKRIIFYAPLGKDTPVDRIGGAEAGCLKTKLIYSRAGIDVIILHKPAQSRGRFRFLLEMIAMPIRMMATTIYYGKNAPVHIVGFYNRIVKYEWFLMKLAHLCGNKVIYELRNGSMISTYTKGSKRYRKYLKDLLLLPEVVLCQGREYVEFIKKNWGVERSYYPNYILDDFIIPNNLERQHPVRIIYFGRVTESKNIDVVIKTLKILNDSGLDATLDIIGGSSQEYKKALQTITNQEGIEERVSFFGRMPFEFIADKLHCSHYFVFPSTEEQEGHSNSLTEAMGCGVVPIVSNAGFNSSICGCEDLVVSGINPQDYAYRILQIEKDGRWGFYSNYVYQRVLNNYTESVVGHQLIETVDRLYE